jgi:hypothetical protein
MLPGLLDRQAIEKVNQSFFYATPGDWDEKNFAGLLGTMTQRYTLRGKFVGNEHHQFEVIPFALMDMRSSSATAKTDRSGLRNLTQYLLVQEIPQRMNPNLLDMMKAKIELSLQQCSFDETDDNNTFYFLLLTLFPFVDPDRVEWISFINRMVLDRLVDDANNWHNSIHTGDSL